MSDKDIIDKLIDLTEGTIDHFDREDAMDMLYEVKRLLGKREALEQEPCEDAVSRQAVIDLVNSDWKYEGLEMDVASLPSVNPQKLKTGHWIIKNRKEQGYDIAGIKTWYIQIMCNECGFIKTAIEGHTGQYKYCPQCGCKMIDMNESEE